MAPCTFNERKSNIRVLEGWSLNAAVIASSVGEYQVIRPSTDGLYAGSEDEWFHWMDHLIQHRADREQLACAGYRRVKTEWNWADPESRKKWHPVVAWVSGQSPQL